MTQNAWADALQECEDPSKRDANLWAQCFAEADGDESKAKAAYVKNKVAGTQQTPEKPRHERRGYCPFCADECDMLSTYCTTCRTSLGGLKRPTQEKPSQISSSYSSNQPSQSSSRYSTDQQTHTVQLVKTAKSRGTYVILGVLLGMMGIHNFYAGRFMRGALQLASTALLGWFVVGLVITCIWVFIDLFTVKTDGSGDAFS